MTAKENKIQEAIRVLADAGYHVDVQKPNTLYLVRKKQHDGQYSYGIRKTFFGNMKRRFHRSDEEVTKINIKSLKWTEIKGNSHEIHSV